jgi:isopenicillin N synthase-like dioxygenase
MMQYLTNSYLRSTLHKVGLNFRERFAFAYFHEPNFSAKIKPLREFADLENRETNGIQYGRHFTNMFLRNYPDRITSKRIMKENRMQVLKEI